MIANIFLQEIETEPEIIVIEEITKKEAKEKVKNFFETFDGDIYPSELSEKLHIDYELVWEVLKELEGEGLVETGE